LNLKSFKIVPFTEDEKNIATPIEDLLGVFLTGCFGTGSGSGAKTNI
jgi:hypothetical protein